MHVRQALRDGHQPLTSAGTTAVLKSAQRDAPHPVRGSRETWQAVASGGKKCSPASRLYMTDQHTKISFLVDTIADLCVSPRSRLRERRTRTSYELFAANGTTVHTHGCKTLRLDFGLLR